MAHPILLPILRAAIDAGASDVHLKPNAPIVFRIRRQLVPVEAPLQSEAEVLALVQEIVPAHLREQLAREHEIDFAVHLEAVGRVRVNVFQQRGLLSLAFRVVKTRPPLMSELNLPPVLNRIADAPRGIILIAGAIGAGKSTTLAAMLHHINTTARKHIITLEDPIEYIFEDQLSIIEQREVGLDTRDFSSGLRNVLRQDPDVLVIGEMRDAQSASAAMSAANIGHLVISTLHTSDTAKSVQRILEFFPGTERDYARKLFSETLHAVVCQRLIRSSLHNEVIPALEILINNGAVTKLIADNHLEKINGAMELGTGEGMQSFDLALQNLVLKGRISQQDAIEHAANPESLRMIFKGVQLNESRRILGSRD